MKNYNQFILEKRIAQISANVEVTYSFDVIKTIHTDKRSDFDKRGLNIENIGKISNLEIKEFIHFFKKDIVEAIATETIVDLQQFVIRSRDRQLSMAVIAEKVQGNYWKLIVKTVFRETDQAQLKVARGQFVIEK
jgi:hypothetical protein